MRLVCGVRAQCEPRVPLSIGWSPGEGDGGRKTERSEVGREEGKEDGVKQVACHRRVNS